MKRALLFLPRLLFAIGVFGLLLIVGFAQLMLRYLTRTRTKGAFRNYRKAVKETFIDAAGYPFGK